VRSEPDLLRERVVGAVSALLGLLGIDADPLRSRETILLGNLLERAWSEGRDVDLAGLVHDVSSPPFDRIGAFDLEAFFPAKDRTALALALNGLLASPGFAAWTEGEPIDVGRLLYAPDGRPRLSIVSIAHLPDAERMFCVTVLLNEIVAWTRAQPGTSSLRAIVYMDEIFGYFPPTAAPSSKRPMLTLLKQARAFGVGVVLATQNPVDLDYKGLANAGTWFIGRLQTERDKLRVLDGLEGALAASGRAADRASLDRSLSGLGNRVFLMNDVHGHAPVMFQSRWALSYLRGPLTREQIKRLTEARGGAVSASPVKAAPTAAPADDALEPRRPIAGEGVVELFVPPAQSGGELVYRPTAFASARVRYANGRLGVDRVDAVALLAPLAPGDTEPGWSAAEPLGEATAGLEKQPRPDARFARTPGAALRKAEHDRWRRSFVQHVLEHCPIVLLESARLGETSRPGEDEPAFRRRLAELARERRDAAVEALRRRYAPKVAALQERIRRAEERVDAERAEADRQGWDTAVSAGVSILGAVLGGGRRRSLGGARTTLRSATRAAKERDDVARAEAQLAADRERLATLESELEADFRKLAAAHDVAGEPLARIELRPKKADVSVGTIALAWVPWRRDGETWVRA
jgi:hypothetical protein